MPANGVWPPSFGLTTKVVPRTSAILQVYASSVVHAPASLVFDILLNVSEYSKWNTWVPSARILSHATSPPSDFDPNDLSHMRIGSTMEFHVVMNSSKPDSISNTPLKVIDICTPNSPTTYLSPEMLADESFTGNLSKVYRVSWTGNGGMYAFGLKLERVHEVIVRGDNECEVRSWELMSGLLARVVKAMYEKTLNEKVELWCADLKKYCEKVHAAT